MWTACQKDLFLIPYGGYMGKQLNKVNLRTFDYMAQTTSTMAHEAVQLLRFKKQTPQEFACWGTDHIQILNLTAFLGHDFKNKSFLLQAIAHTSFVHEFPHLKLSSNERLEFLGDTILQTLITVMIMKKYPDLAEGCLSKLRDSLVNEKTLASLARLMELGNVVLLGRGEIKGRGMERDALLSNLFESILGAGFYDGGYVACQKILENIFAKYQKETHKSFISLDRLQEFDSKSQLQERCMALYGQLPQYRGKKMNEGFKMELIISGKLFGSLIGPSKKKIQEILARQALAELE